MSNLQFKPLPMTEDVPLTSNLITNNPAVPDPEVKATKPRRRFTAKYKLGILAEVDACTSKGQIGAILRREGLYSSHLTTWRRQREEIEQIAQHYAARLIANRSECKENDNSPNYQEVDIASLELIRPRTIGVEHIGLEAIKSLNLPKILEEVGFNKMQR